MLWNTVYIDRAIAASTRNGAAAEPDLLKYLSPLGWEHINLTGDYQWKGKPPHRAKSDPCGLQTTLSVLYRPFSDGTLFATAAILKSKGVMFAQEPKKEPWGSIALIMDPGGKQFALSSKGTQR